MRQMRLLQAYPELSGRLELALHRHLGCISRTLPGRCEMLSQRVQQVLQVLAGRLDELMLTGNLAAQEDALEAEAVLGEIINQVFGPEGSVDAGILGNIDMEILNLQRDFQAAKGGVLECLRHTQHDIQKRRCLARLLDIVYKPVNWTFSERAQEPALCVGFLAMASSAAKFAHLRKAACITVFLVALGAAVMVKQCNFGRELNFEGVQRNLDEEAAEADKILRFRGRVESTLDEFRRDLRTLSLHRQELEGLLKQIRHLRGHRVAVGRLDGAQLRDFLSEEGLPRAAELLHAQGANGRAFLDVFDEEELRRLGVGEGLELRRVLQVREELRRPGQGVDRSSRSARDLVAAIKNSLERLDADVRGVRRKLLNLFEC